MVVVVKSYVGHVSRAIVGPVEEEKAELGDEGGEVARHKEQHTQCKEQQSEEGEVEGVDGTKHCEVEVLELERGLAGDLPHSQAQAASHPTDLLSGELGLLHWREGSEGGGWVRVECGGSETCSETAGSLATKAGNDAESGEEEHREGVLEGDEVAVAGRELVEVAKVQEVFVVEESAPADDLSVGGVHLGDDHSHEDGGEDEREGHVGEVGSPHSLERREVDATDGGLDEELERGVKGEGGGLLGEEGGEEVGGEQEEHGGEEEPDSETGGVELDHLGEGPEEASDLEGEEEAEGDEDSNEATIVGLDNWRLGKEVEVITETGTGVVKLSGDLKEVL